MNTLNKQNSTRKVIYSMMVSLDGFIETVESEINWTKPDEELHQHFNDQESTIDTHLYGRRLYENMSSFWPTADENPSASAQEIEYSRIWKNATKVVFSKTLDKVEWNSTLVRDNIAQVIKDLKERPGKNMDLGGAEIAAEFMKQDLIDEYRLYVHPVILGNGKPMFQGLDRSINLKLVESRSFGCGVVLLRYER
ncbi:dihydrofolate reductase family protein [Bacillus horti]|uniref:Dihydrofolate reductase n=1 Tax=Caldalkalibacillus horti TaxID=77523 RepID=A0ABT9VYS2_9BACI|nr:dihydrofolate reductase family protein [Bacillus horti]MDQ0165977.1 dihydrofolate reductase [Bacillus horti]